jgi:hypothetical protein
MVMVAAASVTMAAPSVMVAVASVMVASSAVMMPPASMMMAAAAVMVAAAVIVGAAMIVSAVVARMAPTIPPVASAPAQAGAIGIPAPIPAGALPTGVIPTVIAAVEDELSLLERQNLIWRRDDESAVR